MIIIFPTIIQSIAHARETNNPAYPFLQLGVRLSNADHLIYEDVQLLKEDPSLLVGLKNPEQGVWSKFKYGWAFFWGVIWRLFGNIWLITVPFVFFYRVLKMRQTSEPAKNLTMALIFGFLFILFINLIIIIVNLLSAEPTLILPEGDMYDKSWFLIKIVLPFHGIIALANYIYTSLGK